MEQTKISTISFFELRELPVSLNIQYQKGGDSGGYSFPGTD